MAIMLFFEMSIFFIEIMYLNWMLKVNEIIYSSMGVDIYVSNDFLRTKFYIGTEVLFTMLHSIERIKVTKTKSHKITYLV
jgi:hypothetical protein